MRKLIRKIQMKNKYLTIVTICIIAETVFGQLGQYSKKSIGNDSTEFIGGQKLTVSTGTGFALSSKGYIVTNFHVIDKAHSIEVRGIEGNALKKYSAEVIIIDERNDLAVLKINDDSFTTLGYVPYTFKTGLAEVGESVFTLGYPMSEILGEEIKLTNGVISSKTGIKGDLSTYQISVPIQPGNSGGPLFDSNGNLIGITSSGISRKLNITENVNYAIKNGYLISMLESLTEKISLPNNNLLKGKSLHEQVKIAKDFVYQIIVNENYFKDLNNTIDYVYLGQEALNRGDVYSAIKHFQTFREMYPEKFAFIYDFLGICYEGVDDDIALKYYFKSIEIDSSPKECTAYLGIGRIFNRKNNSIKAISFIQKGININPDHDELYCEMGYAYLKIAMDNNNINYFNKATEFLQKAIDINPNYEKAQKLLCNAYMSLATLYFLLEDENIYSIISNCNKTIDYFQLILSYCPTLIDYELIAIAYKTRGIAKIATGNKSEGISDLKTAAGLGNNDAKRYLKQNYNSW